MKKAKFIILKDTFLGRVRDMADAFVSHYGHVVRKIKGALFRPMLLPTTPLIILKSFFKKFKKMKLFGATLRSIRGILRSLNPSSLKLRRVLLAFISAVKLRSIRRRRINKQKSVAVASSTRGERPTISILIPCHNEAKSIKACVDSCLNQTRKADRIIVVDDGSTDRSPEILAGYGSKIEVITIPKATGNKSYAQERGLKAVTTDIFFATDGDTVLSPEVIAEVEKSFLEYPEAAAVGGYVKSMKFNWLTACRELDYLIGQNLHKVAQANVEALFVIPGCAGAFKTKIFKERIGFDHDTLTEDLDFTYKLHRENLKIVYNRRMVVSTQDPGTFSAYVNQMRRWYCGGWQNLRKHFSVVGRPGNALQLSLTYAEGLMFSVALLLFPFINIKFFAFFIVPYIVFLLALGTYGAIVRKRRDLLLYAPGYVLLIFTNAYIFLEQFWKEIVLGRMNLTWFHPARREITEV